MPDISKRITEMESGHFAETEIRSAANLHQKGELIRERQFHSYVDTARRHAPPGKWLEIGCGVGTLMRLALGAGIEVQGIELTPDRRELARRVTGATVYDQPLEVLDFTTRSFAAVILINVFSHLVSPSETLSHIHRVLAPDGVVLIHTSEIGHGARKHHMFSWELGNHLYFLGRNTIERYADKCGFELVHRDTHWQPETIYTRARFQISGRSRVRNFVKLACLYTPGVLPMLRWHMLNRRHVGNPVYDSTLVLKKSPSAQ